MEKEDTSKFAGRGGGGGALNEYHPCYAKINKKGIRNANIPKKGPKNYFSGQTKKILF